MNSENLVFLQTRYRKNMKNTLKASDAWILYEGTWHNELPIILRIRQDLNEFIGNPKYPTGYRITWTFENPKEAGYPSSTDNDALEKFENLIFNSIEREQQCIVVAVITHDGERDWVIYTSDPDVTHDRLIKSLSGEPPFPIKISASDDPDWEEYKGIQRNIEGKIKR